MFLTKLNKIEGGYMFEPLSYLEQKIAATDDLIISLKKYYDTYLVGKRETELTYFMCKIQKILALKFTDMTDSHMVMFYLTEDKNESN